MIRLVLMVLLFSVSGQAKEDIKKKSDFTNYYRLGADSFAPRYQGVSVMPLENAKILEKSNMRPSLAMGDAACRQVVRNSHWCSIEEERRAAVLGPFTWQETVPETLDRTLLLLAEMIEVNNELEELLAKKEKNAFDLTRIKNLEGKYIRLAVGLNLTIRFLESDRISGSFAKGRGIKRLIKSGYLNFYCEVNICHEEILPIFKEVSGYLKQYFSNFYTKGKKPDTPPYHLPRVPFNALLKAKFVDLKLLNELKEAFKQEIYVKHFKWGSVSQAYCSDEIPQIDNFEYETLKRDCLGNAKTISKKRSVMRSRVIGHGTQMGLSRDLMVMYIIAVFKGTRNGKLQILRKRNNLA